MVRILSKKGDGIMICLIDVYDTKLKGINARVTFLDTQKSNKIGKIGVWSSSSEFILLLC